MSELPYIDEHSCEVSAPPSVVWEALRQSLSRSLGSRRSTRIASLLGTRPAAAHGDPGAVGASLPGFRVERAVPGRELGLAGTHRFAAYELVFSIDDLGAGRSRLRATTNASFPGPQGRVYRALVIGSRGHVLATRRMLGAVSRQAESVAAA